MTTLLTIAGFDPSSGAGVTADLFVFAAHGFFGTSCLTALTVQSTMGVRATHPVDASILADMLDCLSDDLPPAGIKIGMLGTEQAVGTVCTFLETLRDSGSKIPVVVDPVLRATSGKCLLQPDAERMLRRRLLPLADWVTPNLDELGWLTGTLVSSRADMVRSSEALKFAVEQSGACKLTILAKGGHLEKPDDLLLERSGDLIWLPGDHVDTRATHGTGCALSSALLCRLVMGDHEIDAARNAKHYVAEAMRRSKAIGKGQGPMNHLWPVGSSAAETPASQREDLLPGLTADR